MNITIIGTGNMARGNRHARARRRARRHAAGHRARRRPQALAGELSGDVRAGTVGDPLSGDVVVLAVPYQRRRRRARPLRRPARRQGRRRHHEPGRLLDLHAAHARGRLGRAGDRRQGARGAKVVKAFNTTFAGTLVEGQVAGQPLDVFVASDDEEAKRTVAELVEDGGMRAGRRRPARPRPRARGARLPAHGAAAAARHRLLERDQDPGLSLAPAGRRRRAADTSAGPARPASQRLAVRVGLEGDQAVVQRAAEHARRGEPLQQLAAVAQSERHIGEPALERSGARPMARPSPRGAMSAPRMSRSWRAPAGR